MDNPWPALYTLASLALLLVLVIRYRVQAFVALLIASLALGLASGMEPPKVVSTMLGGIGDLLREIAVILALGAMLGRMLEASGGAEAIAAALIGWFGRGRTPTAVLLASFLIGLPVLFNVGFLLLIPIVWRLQRQTGDSLLWFLLPMSLALGVTHSLVPPHPGIVGAVTTLAGPHSGRVMVETIVFGTGLSLVLALAGWLLPGAFWARRQHVTVPETLAGPAPPAAEPDRRGPFGASVLVIALPLVLCLLGFGVKLVEDLGGLPAALTAPWVAGEVHPALAVLHTRPADWLRFLGNPTVALFVATGVAFWLLGGRRGFDRGQLAAIADKALQDVGAMVFLFGAAGGFKDVIKATGAGDQIAAFVGQLPVSPVLTAFLVALVRIALGSATASIMTASALLAGVAQSLPGQETLLVLAVATGVTVGTQPADSGFWMVKEYGNLGVRDVLVKFNACRAFMAVLGLAILLVVERWFFRG